MTRVFTCGKRNFREMDTDDSGIISPSELANFSISHVFELPTGTTTIEEDELPFETLNGGPPAAPQVAEDVPPTCGQPDGGDATSRRPANKKAVKTNGSTKSNQFEQSWWTRNFICDESLGAKAKQKYQFLVKSYDPECYWFELIEYARKLLVLGVLLFADQGSISQMYLALVISFTVVLITTRYMPFKNDQTDIYKVAMDVNLFFTFSCALLLKLNLAGEFLSPDFYDITMTASNFIIGVLPAIWSVWHTCKVLKHNVTEMLDSLVEANRRAKPEEKLTRLDMLKQLFRANKKQLKDLKRMLSDIAGVEDESDLDDEEEAEDKNTEDTNEADPAMELGNAAIQVAIEELKSVLEPLLESKGFDWDADVLPTLELVDSVEAITEILEHPEEFFQQLTSAVGPVAIRRAVANLRPKIEPWLHKQALRWEEVLPALNEIGTMEKLQDAMKDPEGFLEVVLSSSSLSAAESSVEPSAAAAAAAVARSSSDLSKAEQITIASRDATDVGTVVNDGTHQPRVHRAILPPRTKKADSKVVDGDEIRSRALEAEESEASHATQCSSGTNKDKDQIRPATTPSEENADVDEKEPLILDFEEANERASHNV
eukprot:SAG11_NODE_2518_length_3265_cov_1.241314_2_plen_602_part_00